MSNNGAQLDYTLAPQVDPEILSGKAAGRSWQHYRARIASLSRDRAEDDPELLAAYEALRIARRDSENIRVTGRICELIAQTPLTAAQRGAIVAAVLARGGDHDAS